MWVSLAANAADPVAVRRIALVAASDPAEFTVQSKTGLAFLVPLAATVMHFNSKDMTQQFSERIRARQPNYAAFFTEQVMGLRAAGYQVFLLSDIARPADAPDSIDYEKAVFDADIALQVRIDEMGFYSGMGSRAFVPKIAVGGISFTRGGASYPYDAGLLYGVGAKADKDWAVESPESANFDDFEALMAGVGAVDAVYRDALTQLAQRLASQFQGASPLAAGEAC